MMNPTLIKLTSVVTKDFWRKLIALLLAIASWYGITRSQEKAEGQVNNLEITITSADNRLFVENRPQVTLKYRRPVSGNVEENDITFELDPLSTKGRLGNPVPIGTTPGSRRHSVTYQADALKSSIKVPRGIEITDITPDKIVIEYDEYVTAQRPVRLVTQGVLEDGYAFKLESELVNSHSSSSGATLAAEPMVSVYGPSEQVNSITELTAEAIKLSKTMKTPFSVEVPIIAPRNVQIIPEKIKVAVKIENTQEIGEQKFQNIRLNVLYRQNNKLRLVNQLPDIVEAIVKGRKPLFEEMKKNGETLQAYVDLSQFGQPGKYETEVKILNVPSPRGIREVMWTNPGKLTVELEAYDEFSEENAPMDVSYETIKLLALNIGNADLTLVKPLPRTIAATIRARKSTFDRMQRNNEVFTAYVDLSPYTQPGVYENVKVHILAPPDESGILSEVEIKPGELQIELAKAEDRLMNVPPPEATKTDGVTLDRLASEAKEQP